MKTSPPLTVLTLALAGCATRPAPVVAIAEAPPPVEVAAPPLPPGATPGMLVPAALADGSFPTPNRGLTGVAAMWHLRAGLNVAALSCPGEEGAVIRASYNAWLNGAKLPLARAAKAYAASYPVKTGAGSYDDAMTRLYNFFSQTPVRASFCAAAADLAALPPATDERDAADRLALLDRPFADFYRAYDAWRSGGRPRTVIATATPLSGAPIPVGAPRLASATMSLPPIRPRPAMLTLDLSSLPADSQVTAAR